MDTSTDAVEAVLATLRRRACKDEAAHEQLARLMALLRHGAELTLQAVRDESGLSTSTVVSVEHGDRIPTTATLRALVTVYRRHGCVLAVCNGKIWVTTP